MTAAASSSGEVLDGRAVEPEEGQVRRHHLEEHVPAGLDRAAALLGRHQERGQLGRRGASQLVRNVSPRAFLGKVTEETRVARSAFGPLCRYAAFMRSAPSQRVSTKFLNVLMRSSSPRSAR